MTIAARRAMDERVVARLAPAKRRNTQRGPHLWEIPAVLDLLVLLSLGAGIVILYALRGIFIPVFLALALAYLCNPVITSAERRWGIPRPLSISLLMIFFVLGAAAFVAWLAPLLGQQMQSLAKKAPQYLQTLGGRYGIELTELSEPILSWTSRLQADPLAVFQPIFSGTGQALGFIGAVIGTTTYIAVTAMLVPIYFFMFAWRFDHASSTLLRLLPAGSRSRAIEILAKLDDSVLGFFRGRLLVGLMTGLLYAAGWAWTDVPYWFILGAATGLLTIIPYASVIGWPLAILLKYLDTVGGGQAAGWLSVAVLPSLSYLVVQFLESWWLTPWIQGRTNDLSAVTVIIVVLVGGAVGGFLGLLLAIPIASAAKIVFHELVLPRWEAWAAKR